MMPLHTSLKRKKAPSVLAALETSTNACSVEREGSVPFSFEDLRNKFAHPIFPRRLPNFAWSSQREQHEQMTPFEQSYFWGNDPRIDGCAPPALAVRCGATYDISRTVRHIPYASVLQAEPERDRIDVPDDPSLDLF